MNKDNAKDYLPLVKALSEGKTIKQKFNGDWIDGKNWAFDQPPEHYLIEQSSKPEPEKWVPCGKLIPELNRFCNLSTGHSGDCSCTRPVVRESNPCERVECTPTCVHCGKDPNVKSERDKEYEAYTEFLKINGWVEKDITNKAWCSGMNYARKEGLK